MPGRRQTDDPTVRGAEEPAREVVERGLPGDEEQRLGLLSGGGCGTVRLALEGQIEVERDEAEAGGHAVLPQAAADEVPERQGMIPSDR